MTDDIDALLAALDHEIEERHRACPYGTDEERLAALKLFIAEHQAQPSTSRSFEPLSQEDKDRARALMVIMTKERPRGGEPTAPVSEAVSAWPPDACHASEQPAATARRGWMNDEPEPRGGEPEPRGCNLGVLFRRSW